MKRLPQTSDKRLSTNKDQLKRFIIAIISLQIGLGLKTIQIENHESFAYAFAFEVEIKGFQ